MTFTLKDLRRDLPGIRRRQLPRPKRQTAIKGPAVVEHKKPLEADSSCTQAIDKRAYSFVNGEPAILSLATPFWADERRIGDWAAKYTGLVGWRSARKKTIVVGRTDVHRLQKAISKVDPGRKWKPYTRLRGDPAKHAKEMANLIVYLPAGNYPEAAKKSCCSSEPRSDSRVGHECDPSWCPFSDACASEMVDECSGFAKDGKTPRVLDPTSPCFQWCEKNPALCDEAKMNFCRKNPLSKACSCIYRSRDPEYTATVSRLRSLGVRVPAQETCWVAQCADPTRQLILSSEAPNTCNTSVSVCRNVLSVDDGADVVIGNASFSTSCQAQATELQRQKKVAAEQKTRADADKERDAELASQRAAADRRERAQAEAAKNPHTPQSTIARETPEPDPIPMPDNNRNNSRTPPPAPAPAARSSMVDMKTVALAGAAVVAAAVLL